MTKYTVSNYQKGSIGKDFPNLCTDGVITFEKVSSVASTMIIDETKVQPYESIFNQGSQGDYDRFIRFRLNQLKNRIIK
jgi:hypothetical protein